MKIIDLFARLSYGELSNLSISGEGSGTLVQAKHPQIIQYVNEGLLRLHSRFRLKESDLIIEQVDHITNYHLRIEFAESQNNCDVPFPYIKDLPDEPFTGDVIKILEVHDSLGRELVLNDKNDPCSLFLPQPDVLQVPNPIAGVALGIMYQARHPVLRTRPIREEDITEQTITIPFYLEGALQAFVASQVYGHMNGQENIAKSQEYLAVSEAICLGVEQNDLANQSISTTNLKFHQRGFV